MNGHRYLAYLRRFVGYNHGTVWMTLRGGDILHLGFDKRFVYFNKWSNQAYGTICIVVLGVWFLLRRDAWSHRWPPGDGSHPAPTQQAPGRPGKPRGLIRRVYSIGSILSEGTDFEQIHRGIDGADELLVVTAHGLSSSGLDSVIAYAANRGKRVRWTEEWIGGTYNVPGNQETPDGISLCQSGAIGRCRWGLCPQLHDREPATSGRKCPRWQAEIDAGLWSTE